MICTCTLSVVSLHALCSILKDGEDFLSVTKNVTFQATEPVACGDVAIIDDTNPENPEPFGVSFDVPGDSGGVIIPEITATATVTIIDDDGGKSVNGSRHQASKRDFL